MEKVIMICPWCGDSMIYKCSNKNKTLVCTTCSIEVDSVNFSVLKEIKKHGEELERIHQECRTKEEYLRRLSTRLGIVWMKTPIIQNK